MNARHQEAITDEDVELFRKHLEHQKRNATRESALKRLIAAGSLSQDGTPRWPKDAGKEIPPAKSSK